jgi:hypothetical protein
LSVLCFVTVATHVIELSKVTHMVAADEGGLVVVHVAGGGQIALGPAESDMLFAAMDGLARKGAIVCVDARADVPGKPAPPAPPPPVQLDLIPEPARSSRGKRSRPTPQKASA